MFVEHSNCTYMFEWGTKYACTNDTYLVNDGTCSVTTDAGKRFDLSALVKETGNKSKYVYFVSLPCLFCLFIDWLLVNSAKDRDHKQTNKQTIVSS